MNKNINTFTVICDRCKNRVEVKYRTMKDKSIEIDCDVFGDTYMVCKKCNNKLLVS